MAALSGVIAGILGFAFARIFAEPVIGKAIAYESGRDDILAALNKGVGRAVAPDGPQIFSRTAQSTIGFATGIIAFFAATGALVAVAYLVVYGGLIGLLPSLGDLPANVAASSQFGYARAATETPPPIVNILSTPLVVDGKTIAPGQIVYRASTRMCSGSSAGTRSSTRR